MEPTRPHNGEGSTVREETDGATLATVPFLYPAFATEVEKWVGGPLCFVENPPKFLFLKPRPLFTA